MKKFIVAVVFAVSGCAFIPQQAYLNPHVDIAKQDIGKGQKIAVKVVDERLSDKVGGRGFGLNPGAQITLTSVDDAILQQVKEGFTKEGFEVSPSGKKVELKVKLIDYSMSAGLVAGGVHVRSAIQVVVPGSDFDKLYRSTNDASTFFVPTSDKNQTMIDDSVSEVLSQILNDRELTSVLVK